MVKCWGYFYGVFKTIEDMIEREFYHACSEGLEKSLIFRNREEFIVGMNYVAICEHKFKVRILCFCLMGNHFHFILSGTYDECWRFMNEYKRMCAMMMKRLQGKGEALKNVEIQMKRISDRSYLEAAIAYVLRNPVAAGLRLMPDQYPWGSGSMYFRRDYMPKGRRADEFPIRKLMHEILHSKTAIPGDYIIDESGIVSPLCYIDYKTVEEVFGHPSRLMGLLSSKKEAEFELFLGIADKYNPDLEELKDSVRELIDAEFGVRAISQLSMEQKIILCSLMRRNFHASRKQIALITRLNLETVNQIV